MNSKDMNSKDQQEKRQETHKKTPMHKRVKKVRNRLILLLVIILAILLLILSGYLGLSPLGFFPDRSGSHSIEMVLDIKEEDPSNQESANDVDQVVEGLLILVIKDGDYIIDGQVVTFEVAKERIETDSTKEIQLVDQVAKQTAFEAVEDLVVASGKPYSVKEDY